MEYTALEIGHGQYYICFREKKIDTEGWMKIVIFVVPLNIPFYPNNKMLCIDV